MAEVLNPSAIENPNLCLLYLVGDPNPRTIAVDFKTAQLWLAGAAQQGAAFLTFPIIHGEIVVNLGAFASLEPYRQKGLTNE